MIRMFGLLVTTYRKIAVILRLISEDSVNRESDVYVDRLINSEFKVSWWIVLDFQEKNLNFDRDLNHGSPDHQPGALNHWASG